MDILTEADFFSQQPIYTTISDIPMVDLHKHCFFEVFYVIHGEAKHVINNQNFNLIPGSICIVPPNIAHQFFPKKQHSVLLHRNILIKTSEFKRICDFVNPQLYDFLANQKNISCYNISVQVINNFEKQIELFIGSHKFYSIIIEILSSFVNCSDEKQSPLPLWIQELLPILDTPQSFTLPFSEIIKDIHFNPAYISATFKKYLGISITQYHLNIKLQYAYTLILSSRLSIETIAQQCGFDSLSYFYKAFKKIYNLPPGTLRKKGNSLIALYSKPQLRL